MGNEQRGGRVRVRCPHRVRLRQTDYGAFNPTHHVRRTRDGVDVGQQQVARESLPQQGAGKVALSRDKPRKEVHRERQYCG